MEHVSVRELRQHLSRYLRRVEKGERLVVTERRRPVAVLAPLPEEDDVLDYLIAIGEATPGRGNLPDLPPPTPSASPGPPMSEILDDLRATRSDVAYLDASALVKAIVEEDESEPLRLALGAYARHASSRVVVVEVLRGVIRRDPTKEPLARRVLGTLVLLGVSGRILLTASTLDPPTLRSLDALHVASAARLGHSLAAFVSYDERQLEAAVALGLPVASPR